MKDYSGREMDGLRYEYRGGKGYPKDTEREYPKGTERVVDKCDHFLSGPIIVLARVPLFAFSSALPIPPA